MSNIKVKICGVKTLEAAHIAVEAGADFLGFNFVVASKRFIDPMIARAIAKEVDKKVSLVGVFQNQTADEVNTIANLVGLDYVQLHGEEDEENMKKINAKIIKMVVIPDTCTPLWGIIGDPVICIDSLFRGNDNIIYFLLDRVSQGQGDMVDLARAKGIAQQCNVFLAGGLTPDNVAEIVATVKPFAVDVAGGIETDGEQDMEKIRKFIKNAKELVI
jgi:phosphoribosylanthranilate isomerase